MVMRVAFLGLVFQYRQKTEIRKRSGRDQEEIRKRSGKILATTNVFLAAASGALAEDVEAAHPSLVEHH